MEIYEKPGNDEITSHAGNYAGTRVQIQKLVASTINEFFIFLKKSADVFVTTEFKEIVDRLAKSDKQLWDGMVSAAHNKLPTATDLLKTIVQVRSNIAFHYDHSGKILRNAYISRFFGKSQDGKSKLAYYSIGDTIGNTRFYFSDAAAEESMHIAAGKKPKEDVAVDSAFTIHQEQIIQTIEAMSATISSILKNYIQVRRRPR